MTILVPHFYKRDLSSGLSDRLFKPELDFEVQRYSFDAIGGPKDARINATGDLPALWQLTAMLRLPIEIYDEQGTNVWWGTVNEIKIQTQILELSLSLENMANSIAVAYSTQAGGQTGAASQAMTGFATNADSIAEFGTKQMILSGRNMTQTQAEAFRDAALDRLRFPVPEIELKESDSISGEIRCVGWWKTLEWGLVTEAATGETISASHTNTQQDFTDAATEKVGQTFDVNGAQDFVLEKVSVWIKKTGSPANDLTVAVYEDSGGSPGSLVDSATLAESDISVDFDVEVITMTGGATLTAGTTYWIVLELAAGSGDASNYYSVGTNENNPYADGAFQTHDGVSWSSDATRDMAAAIFGSRATNTQIENILDDAVAGQFFTGHDVEATGINAPALADGDFNALEIMAELLTATSNNKRLVANVTRNRRVVIEEEPASEDDGGDSNHFLMNDLSLENSLNVPIPKHHAGRAVQKWVTPKSLMSIIGNTPRFADLTNIFIEEARYDARRDELEPRTRGQRDLFELVKLASK